MIEVDAEYFVPLDIQTYYMDLDKANKEKNPTWELMHTFTEDYQIPDLSPASLLTLAEKIRDSEDVAAEYLWNKDKRHGGKGSCDAGCRKSNFCDVTSIETKEKSDCNGSKKRGFSDALGDLSSWLSFLTEPWIIKRDQ